MTDATEALLPLAVNPLGPVQAMLVAPDAEADRFRVPPWQSVVGDAVALAPVGGVLTVIVASFEVRVEQLASTRSRSLRPLSAADALAISNAGVVAPLKVALFSTATHPPP